MDKEVWETWESIYLKVTSLGNKIIERSLEEQQNISRIAVVPRGGLYMANILSRMLGFSGDQILTLGISRYDRQHPTKAGSFKIGQLPSRQDVENQTILLPDEVHDSGETVRLARDKLLELGAQQVITAVIHYKPDNDISGQAPDFFIEKTNGWVHYPWETIDTGGTVFKRVINGGS